jgi:hypothetical protein
MHPDDQRLAAYLDLPADSAERRELRAHILGCAHCTARVARLRDDSARITATFAGPAPDLRAAVAARLAPARRWERLASGGWFAGALACVILFAALIGVQSGTIGYTPDRLFVADRAGRRVVELDAASGRTLREQALGSQPSQVAYDERRKQLYVLTERGVVALDAMTLAEVRAWALPANTTRGVMALDAKQERLYVAGDTGVSVLALAEEQPLTSTIELGARAGALALVPGGDALFALAADSTRLWRIDTTGGAVSERPLSATARQGTAVLAASRDRTALFILLGTAMGGAAPQIWRLDLASDTIVAQHTLPLQPPPWDIALLGEQRLVVAQSDGTNGAVTLLDATTLQPSGTLEPGADAHRLVVGRRGELYGLNWLHGTVTRYDTREQAPLWRAGPDAWQPWDAVLVPGGWRFAREPS